MYGKNLTHLKLYKLIVYAFGSSHAEIIKNQIGGQIISVLVTIIWSAVVAFIAIKIADILCKGIRSDEDAETEGLDLADHGEDGYQLYPTGSLTSHRLCRDSAQPVDG